MMNQLRLRTTGYATRGLPLLLAIFALLFATVVEAGRGPGLALRTCAFDPAVLCDTRASGCLAGGREGLEVRITRLAQPRYPALEPGWPAGLTIEAGDMHGDTFVSDAALTRLLDIQRFMKRFFAGEDSLAHARGEMTLTQRSMGAHYYFILNVPEAYAGERIHLRAVYDTPETGRLLDGTAFDVVAPCSEAARQAVQGSFVREAQACGDYDRAVALADSLIAQGWRDQAGLGWAAYAAKFSGRPDAQLRYMDLSYETYGCISSFDCGTDGRSRQRVAQQYQQLRQALLDQIQNQQQPR